MICMMCLRGEHLKPIYLGPAPLPAPLLHPQTVSILFPLVLVSSFAIFSSEYSVRPSYHSNAAPSDASSRLLFLAPINASSLDGSFPRVLWHVRATTALLARNDVLQPANHQGHPPAALMHLTSLVHLPSSTYPTPTSAQQIAKPCCLPPQSLLGQQPMPLPHHTLPEAPFCEFSSSFISSRSPTRRSRHDSLLLQQGRHLAGNVQHLRL